MTTRRQLLLVNLILAVCFVLACAAFYWSVAL